MPDIFLIIRSRERGLAGGGGPVLFFAPDEAGLQRLAFVAAQNASSPFERTVTGVSLLRIQPFVDCSPGFFLFFFLTAASAGVEDPISYSENTIANFFRGS